MGLSPAGLKRLRAAPRWPVCPVGPAGGLALAVPSSASGRSSASASTTRITLRKSAWPCPTEPLLFIKAQPAPSTGPTTRSLRPRSAEKLDYEVELGAVIGRDARNVNEADAMGHVAAYCIVNDVSERAFQMEHGGTTTKGKSADTLARRPLAGHRRRGRRPPGAGSCGPTVNGERRQQGTARQDDLLR